MEDVKSCTGGQLPAALPIQGIYLAGVYSKFQFLSIQQLSSLSVARWNCVRTVVVSREASCLWYAGRAEYESAAQQEELSLVGLGLSQTRHSETATGSGIGSGSDNHHVLVVQCSACSASACACGGCWLWMRLRRGVGFSEAIDVNHLRVPQDCDSGAHAHVQYPLPGQAADPLLSSSYPSPGAKNGISFPPSGVIWVKWVSKVSSDVRVDFCCSFWVTLPSNALVH